MTKVHTTFGEFVSVQSLPGLRCLWKRDVFHLRFMTRVNSYYLISMFSSNDIDFVIPIIMLIPVIANV